MKVAGEKQGDIFVFTLEGRLDTQTYQQVEEKIKEWLKEEESLFLGDLTKLDFVSSAGLRVLLWTAKTLRMRGGKIVLMGLNDVIQEVFEISGITNVIESVTTREEAVRLLHS